MSGNPKKPTFIDILSFIGGIVVVVFLCGFLSNYIGSSLKNAFPKLREEPSPPPSQTFPDQDKILYAILVSTNIVSQPCNCGFCDPLRGIRVPEHVGVIGYDLRIEVSTNYLPVLYIH